MIGHHKLRLNYKKGLGHLVSSVVSLLVFTLLAFGAAAHETRPAVGDIEILGDRAELRIDLTLEPLVAGLDLSQIADTNESPLAAQHDALRALPPAELAALFEQSWPELSQRFQLLAGDTALKLALTDVTAAPVGNVELPRDATIVLSAPLPDDGSDIRFAWAAEFGPIALRHVGVDVSTAYEGYLENGEISAAMPRGGPSREAWIVEFTNWIASGFEHIIPKGWDHILFVLGLFFFSLKMRPLLWQVTAFTVAHTTTLALATLGFVQLPASIVEPLIAASIVYVAVENIFVRRFHAWRTAVVFGFGLLHGLGFASVLSDVGLDPARLISGLIGFNIGVEIGQLTVIAAAFLLVGWWAGPKPWYRRVIATPASIAIALVGAWWLIERTIL